MSEEKHYPDEQWDDIPLPDSDIAWQKMEVLLEKEEKRRIAPFWRYVLPALLLAGAAIGGYVWLSGEKESANANHTAQQRTEHPAVDRAPLPANTEKGFTPSPATPAESKPTAPDPVLPDATGKRDESLTNTSPTVNKNQGVRVNSSVANSTIISNTTASSQPRQTKQSTTKEKTSKPAKEKPAPGNQQPVTSDPVGAETVTPGTVPSTNTTNPPEQDSVATKDTVTTKAAEPVALAVPEKKKKKAKDNSTHAFSAGVGLQQSIAFSGQHSSSYNYKGKKSSLSDRIPSVYVRYQRDKLFIQAEFQYAVPQPVEQFSFSQKTRYDVASLNVNTERFTLQKLYYHQLPVSFNYYVLPDLSVGIGTMYSILAGAVTEQEVSSKHVQTGNESITRNMVPIEGFKDSFLYKSVAGYLLQADYHWNRFSIGLRYTQNLQPFISYTSQNGEIRDEKNKLLQAIIRFRLFQK